MQNTFFCQVLLLIITPLILTSDNFDKCGIQNTDLPSSLFAISGSVIHKLNAPWLASIGNYNGTENVENYKVICSGSILTIKVIVTAAHCFHLLSWQKREKDFPSHVRVGSSDKDSRYSEDRKIKEYKSHPAYEYPKYYFDVAVIIIEVELKFSARISAICLPQNPSSQPASNSLTVQGWGENDEGNSVKRASEVRED